MKAKGKTENQSAAQSTGVTLHELVAHFREKRDTLRGQWVQSMTTKGLLSGLTREELDGEFTAIYNTSIGCLDTGRYDDAQAYANRMVTRGAASGKTPPDQILAGVLTLRDVYGRSLFQRYRSDMPLLLAAMDVYEPVANKILSIIALGFVEEREKVVRQQQEAIREISTPVLQIRDGMLLLPIIGLLDSLRARQLTEQLLRSIRSTRAKVVVIDITGVSAIDSKVANHLLQTVDAARLMGAKVIVTGLSAQIAQTLVGIGVDLRRMITMCDLQGGIEEADRLIGDRVTRINDETTQT